MNKEKIVRTKQVSHTRNEQRMLCAVQVRVHALVALYAVHLTCYRPLASIHHQPMGNISRFDQFIHGNGLRSRRGTLYSSPQIQRTYVPF